MCDSEVDIDLTTWGLEEWYEHRVHLKFLRDSAMDRIVTINAHLVDGIIRKMESDSGVGERPADANKNFANDLIWIDTDRVYTKRLWLPPLFLRCSGESREMATRTRWHVALQICLEISVSHITAI